MHAQPLPLPTNFLLSNNKIKFDTSSLLVDNNNLPEIDPGRWKNSISWNRSPHDLMAARNDSVSLISPVCMCVCVYSSISICGRKERNWRAERAINANLVISVAPTVSHGRNKYPLATVKASTIAPTVYDPPLHHGFTRA